MRADITLINCINKLEFELDPINGHITDLQRLLLTNFVDDGLLVTFNLRMHLKEYEEAQNRINHFISQIQKASGQSDIKYLAVLDFPGEKSDFSIYVNLITDIEIGTLTLALNGVFKKSRKKSILKHCGGTK